ncbi:MAG: 4-deoxy-4-formamido-L-arabinose-phosphoundecaprenol deformylase, partial [Gammaproteobacteria bacterium]|nr:4-deoxy-4-formamido-L-arabinose-phosphoundecaprenol deformylase [Gammaproteobacteria bacterium]
APLVHGAAGWQMNRFVPALQRELGFRYASDTRGRGPFLPVPEGDGRDATIPQLPTTLPTLDELIGRDDLGGADPVDHLLAASDAAGVGEQVFTLHAELEGAKYLPAFERLLQGWRARGVTLTDLATYAATLDVRRLPRCHIVAGKVAGRSGALAVQSAPLR